jgi:hypothetical protein
MPEVADRVLASYNLRGKRVLVTRATLNPADVSTAHVYGLRHRSSDWAEPVTAEAHVLCNNCGTLISAAPLKLDENGAFRFTRREREELALLLSETA